MLLSVVLSLALPLAAAEDCDAKALAAEVAEASNLMAPDKFAELAACDAAAANKIAAKEMPRFLGGAEVNFYAANFQEVPHAEAALREWNKRLFADTCFVRHGEETCWQP